jgi:hypothetical protein
MDYKSCVGFGSGEWLLAFTPRTGATACGLQAYSYFPHSVHRGNVSPKRLSACYGFSMCDIVRSTALSC